MLFSTLLKDGTDSVDTLQFKEIMGVDVVIFYVFMVITIFFISVVVLYLSAKKDQRNQKDIYKISAYKIVFYDENPKPNVNINAANEKNYWDLFLFEMMRENKGKKPSRKRNKLHKPVWNKPEFLLSSFASFMELCFLIVLFGNFFKRLGNVNSIDWYMVIICCVYFVTSLCLLFVISQISISSNQRYGIIKEHLQSFIKYAIKIGYYANENDVKKKYGDDFWQDVMVCRQE